MLHNTKYRLDVNKSLKIAFFGGSITDGTGASDKESSSYRALVTDWFRRTYPDADITSVNASIGGTGTGYAMLRCERDLIAHSPELVFVEFAANDWGDTFENVLPQVETVFRKIRMALPETDIVALFSTYNDIARDTELGHEYESRSAHITASHRYGIPTIDMGTVLHAQILKSGCDFDKFIPDTLHPNDDGHRIYADAVTSNLRRWLGSETASQLTAHPLPRSIGTTWDHAHILAPSEIQFLSLSGFRIKHDPDGSRYGECLETTKEGSSFTFSFTGCGCGFCWGRANVGGDVMVAIDGGEPICIRNWDHYVRSFDRLRSAIVTRELQQGEHRVCVKAMPFRPTEESPDCTVRIDGIFVF